MMLLRCCTPYARKFGKLSSGHRTGKGQFSLQSQERAMPKNSSTVVLISRTSKVMPRLLQAQFQQCVNWKQTYKLGFKEAEEPEIKLPSFVGSWRKQENSRKTPTLLHWLYSKAFDCVDCNKLWKIFNEMGKPDHLTASWEISMQVKKQQDRTYWLAQNREKSMARLYIVTLFI